MAWSLVAAPQAVAGSSSPTTSGIDTSGANLILIAVADFSATHPPGDNKSNTYTQIWLQNDNNTNGGFYYCLNPTVGSGHTFTSSGTLVFGSIGALAFSGAAASSALDQSNNQHNTGVAGTQSSGSITPTQSGELIVSCVALNGVINVTPPYTVTGSLTIPSTSYTVPTGAQYDALCMAYLVQTSAAAINPTWTWGVADSSNFAGAAVASFFPAGGGGFKPSWAANSNHIIGAGVIN